MSMTEHQMDQSLHWAREITASLENDGATGEQVLATCAMIASATIISISDEVPDIANNRTIFVKVFDHFVSQMTSDFIDGLIKEYGPTAA